MEKVAFDEPANEARAADETHGLSDPLSLSDMAINYYELAPGDSFSGGLHTHTNQEEIFAILEGTATFETREDTVDVAAEEAIRFAPGEYQEGRNESDGRVRALAMGAPQEDGETRSLFPCRECGAEYHRVEMEAEGMTLVCPDCGNEVEM